MSKAKPETLPETLQELRTLLLESEGIKFDEEVYYRQVQLKKEPITGERILKALERMLRKETMFSDSALEHYQLKVLRIWTLCQPAKEQSEEDLQKIIKLLK